MAFSVGCVQPALLLRSSTQVLLPIAVASRSVDRRFNLEERDISRRRSFSSSVESKSAE